MIKVKPSFSTPSFYDVCLKVPVFATISLKEKSKIKLRLTYISSVSGRRYQLYKFLLLLFLSYLCLWIWLTKNVSAASTGRNYSVIRF